MWRMGWVVWGLAVVSAGAAEQPNILWLTAEDIGPHLGCYGDPLAVTPNLDALAADGIRFPTCWSNYPVCAPARTTIITGLVAASTGSGHMRCLVSIPEPLRLFPEYLREAGYYCTNNHKEDYNVRAHRPTWDESSKRAHWKHRPAGAPFFAVFNQAATHESQIRSRPHVPITDPKAISVPPYHPDCRESRQDWAQYYDNIRKLDSWVGRQIEELKAADLYDRTIIVFFGDHGSGMPRHKRYAGNSGMHVPLIVRVPQRFREHLPKDYAGTGVCERLVSFVDLAPTMLSIANIAAPESFQGSAFLGVRQSTPPDYLYGFRDRMDERPDFSRSMRDSRYLYIRNYLPFLPHGQFLAYQDQTPTTSVWRKLYERGELNPIQTAFWEPKAPEELYDLQEDPHETKNLAGDASQRAVLERFRKAHLTATLRFRDTGFLPEGELVALDPETTRWEYAQHEQTYPLKRIYEFADQAVRRATPIQTLLSEADEGDPVIRYWLAVGYLVRGATAVVSAPEPLVKLLDDPSPSVRIVAAEAAARYGPAGMRDRALAQLLHDADVRNVHAREAVTAMAAIDRLDEKATPLLAELARLPREDDQLVRTPDSLERLFERIVDSL